MTNPALRDRTDAASPARVGARVALQWTVGALALLALLRFSAPLLLPIAGAVVLWLLLGGAADKLERRGVPSLLTAAVLGFGPPAVLTVLGVLAAPACREGLAAVDDAMQQAARLVDASMGQGAAGHWLASRLGGNAQAAVVAWAEREAPGALLGTVSALMLLFFLLLAQRSLTAGVLRALPDLRSRNRFADTLAEARRGVVAFVGVMGAMNLALALATGVCLAALGLPQALFWAAVTFLLVFVPYLGPMAVAALLGVAGLQTFGGGLRGLGPAAAFLALHAVEANFISPWAMGSRLRLGRPALLVSVMVGAWVGGVTGGLLGVPVLIAFAAAWRGSPDLAVVNALLDAEGATSDPSAAPTPATVVGSGVTSFVSVPRRVDE